MITIRLEQREERAVQCNAPVPKNVILLFCALQAFDIPDVHGAQSNRTQGLTYPRDLFAEGANDTDVRR